MHSLSRAPSLIPSILPDNLVPSYEKLNQRVTTRVLGMKILKQRELENNLLEREKTFSAIGSGMFSLTERSRQPSKFLSGASIPNSIIKAEALAASTFTEIRDKNVLREQRDASVKEIVKRMEARIMELYPAPVENEIANESLNTPDIIPKMKSSLSCQRKPTYESIKRAIENSRTCPEIVDVDSIEAKRRRKLELQDSFEARITALVNMQQQQQQSKTKAAAQKKESANKLLAKKGSKASRNSTTSSLGSKKVKRGKKRKPIIKRPSREGSRPIKTVSIMENRKEDTETQTYLNMKDFMLKLKAETSISYD